VRRLSSVSISHLRLYHRAGWSVVRLAATLDHIKLALPDRPATRHRQGA
jgi:hypothetical protein